MKMSEQFQAPTAQWFEGLPQERQEKAVRGTKVFKAIKAREAIALVEDHGNHPIHFEIDEAALAAAPKVIREMLAEFPAKFFLHLRGYLHEQRQWNLGKVIRMADGLFPEETAAVFAEIKEEPGVGLMVEPGQSLRGYAEDTATLHGRLWERTLGKVGAAEVLDDPHLTLLHKTWKMLALYDWMTQRVSAVIREDY